MSLNISRRDFLKKSSIAAAAVGAVPVTSLGASKKRRLQKSRVIIAKDEDSLSGTPVNEEAVQDMIDYSVKHLTGVADLGLAYEGLFPEEVTSSTKIILKRNDISGNGSVNKAVVECLQAGLENMLGGSFPSGNISIHLSGSNMKSKLADYDYIINCPVAHCHDDKYGVTLSCKNTMNYINNASSELHNANKSWLYNVSLNPLVKDKQVLSMMDALNGNNRDGPNTKTNFTAHTIIMSTDIVAVDYNTIRIMEDYTGASKSRLEIGDNQLKDADAEGLGTCDPDEMEIIEIGPPWNDPTPINDAVKSVNDNIRVAVSGDSRVTFSFPSQVGQRSELSVFDLSGRKLWTHHQMGNRYTWRGITRFGKKVSAGNYIYALKVGKQEYTGKISLK